MKVVSSKRERDKTVVLDLARRFGPLSRVAIHELTRLRPSTISMLVRELLREGRLLEAGPSDNPTGRKQVLLRIQEDRGFVASLEFDAEMVVAAVVNLGAHIRHSVKEATYLGGGIEGLVRQLLDCAARAVRDAGIDESLLVGVGVADPGLIDRRQGVAIVSSTIEFWKDVPLRRIFEERFQAPFLLESNSRARTVAERILGAGRMADDMLYLDYGTGIGLGVVTEGQVLRGRGDCACEFGHTHLMEGGPPCKCGSFGCLEAIAGAPAMAARVRNAVLEGGHSAVLDLAGGDPASITGFMVIEAASKGDKMCAAVLEEAERYLALGLANIVNLFNPALVVLDKRLALADPGFLDRINRIVRRQALRRSAEGLSFRLSELGVEAGVLGVALLVIEQIFEIPALKLPRFMAEPALETASLQ